MCLRLLFSKCPRDFLARILARCPKDTYVAVIAYDRSKLKQNVTMYKVLYLLRFYATIRISLETFMEPIKTTLQCHQIPGKLILTAEICTTRKIIKILRQGQAIDNETKQLLRV